MSIVLILFLNRDLDILSTCTCSSAHILYLLLMRLVPTYLTIFIIGVLSKWNLYCFHGFLSADFPEIFHFPLISPHFWKDKRKTYHLDEIFWGGFCLSIFFCLKLEIYELWVKINDRERREEFIELKKSVSTYIIYYF